MIIVCPTCSSKYSVAPAGIDEGKMVRCPLCGTTWQPELDHELMESKKAEVPYAKTHLIRSSNSIAASRHWMFFVSIVLFSLTYMLLKTNYLHRIPSYAKYISNYITKEKKQFALGDLSHYFIKRDDGIYLAITGSISNLSDSALPAPYLSVNLRTYGEDFANYEMPEMFINETWAVKINTRDIAKNQKVLFETEPRKVPINDLMCTIKVGKNI